MSRTSQSCERLLRFHSRLSARTATTDDLDQLQQTVLSELLDLIEADHGSIMVFDSSARKLRLVRSADHPGAVVPKLVKVGAGIAGQVFESGKAVLVSDLGQAPANVQFWRKDRGGSFMALPLKIAGRTIGVLNLERGENRTPFGRKELQDVTAVATQIAAIIEKGRNLEEVSRGRNEFEALYVIIGMLFSGRAFQESLQGCLAELASRLHLERSAVLCLEKSEVAEDVDGEVFRVLASYQLSERGLKKIIAEIRTRMESHLQEKPGASDDAETPSSLQFTERGRSMELFCLPLIVKESARHFLLVSCRTELGDESATTHHYRFLWMLSKQLSAAIEREEMIQELQANQNMLAEDSYADQVSLHISMDLASSLDPRIVLSRAFEQFRRLIAFTTVSILFFDDQEHQYRLQIHSPEPVQTAYRNILVEEMVAIFSGWTTDPPLTDVKDILMDSPSSVGSTSDSPRKYRYKMHLPLVLEEKIKGMIFLTRVNGPEFAPHDLARVSQFNGILMTSIKNALIHRRTEKLAYTDPLTGRFNHRYFQETLSQEYARARRYSKPLSLMILDIDHFKKFNDTYGHLIGDRVLIHAAQVFQRSIREKIDTVSRYGGEEFAVLLPETGIDGAQRFAERIRKALETEGLATEFGDLRVTISIGVSCTIVTQCNKPSDLIEAADLALYQAKDGGRNQVRVYRKETLDHENQKKS